MEKKTNIFAENIKVGSIVSLYGELWLLRGSLKIYDGDFEIDRIRLSSIRDPTVYTFVHPTHQFILENGIYYDSQEIPF